MPVYYDLETEDQVDLTQAECTEVARTFCDKLKAAGYFVGIYCNKYFARDELYASRLSDYHFGLPSIIQAAHITALTECGSTRRPAEFRELIEFATKLLLL